MAQASYLTKLVRGQIRQRVQRLTVLNRHASRMPKDSLSKIMSVVKAPVGSDVAKELHQKTAELEKGVPSKEELAKKDLEDRMNKLADEGKRLKLIIKSLSTQLQQNKKAL